MRLHQAAVRRHRVPGLQDHDVPGDQVAGGQLQPLPVAQHPAGVGHHRLERLRCPLGRVLLNEADTAFSSTTPRIATASCRVPGSRGS